MTHALLLLALLRFPGPTVAEIEACLPPHSVAKAGYQMALDCWRLCQVRFTDSDANDAGGWSVAFAEASKMATSWARIERATDQEQLPRCRLAAFRLLLNDDGPAALGYAWRPPPTWCRTPDWR